METYPEAPAWIRCLHWRQGKVGRAIQCFVMQKHSELLFTEKLLKRMCFQEWGWALCRGCWEKQNRWRCWAASGALPVTAESSPVSQMLQVLEARVLNCSQLTAKCHSRSQSEAWWSVTDTTGPGQGQGRRGPAVRWQAPVPRRCSVLLSAPMDVARNNSPQATKARGGC